MEDYLEGLERAMRSMPAAKGTKERFQIPVPRIFYEGKTTVLDNFAAIADALNRDPDHLMKFLLQELGTAGKIEGHRGVFQGKFTEQAIQNQIAAYVDEYVICSECKLPDTHLIKSDRVLMLKCDACGAHRPVKKRKAKAVVARDVIEEGETYELRIESVGSKGDGIAKVDKYLIFVPNTSKGEIVKAKVKKISGTLAFAEIVERKGKA
ncbi:MAG: translation initiation factor IF-2 subunit beta [Methanothrix sp.]|uniref:Translation initiation factor 2 subunit beta n=1 Tax=Methanothrix thermoacetophila (strain DSM 6194 / JCM 14653 / NBRC 101360 / PT) TaxID=349307 RepID=IF2B_METTP|nr:MULTISPECIES: translation initiation factor IF-2 subunit beta [Methanothrix]A0B5K5.1 RecName: Full=Translation initiation factor 2 subunit beta; AltName: Full=aIF2-beta; AltName: Full=eIF-2-beta [Methanothrix thermoacetophila PT]ABK13979.1 translation initiation factor 2 subunit beta (aeIF-2b) [Methanothrix thermoacetophila PT]MBC7079844.1 translation initiation factor IF-2 subunit beta [Methanothrix sp.]NPU87995.1 translation initiation factor IF-2 subunit beta [Methanothrix sp.]